MFIYSMVHLTSETETVRAFERYRGIIPDYEGCLKASRQLLPAHIRVNTLKIRVEQARG
jgi:hypothetical protein